MAEPGPAVARCCKGDDPACLPTAMYAAAQWDGTHGAKTQADAAHPDPPPCCRSPPHPHPSIQGRSFQQVFHRANKEPPSILKCAMSEKVKVAEGGDGGGRAGRVGGEIPKRLRISQLTLDLPFSLCQVSLRKTQGEARRENSGRRRRERATNAAGKQRLCNNTVTHSIITIFQPDIYYLCTHSLIIPL